MNRTLRALFAGASLLLIASSVQAQTTPMRLAWDRVAESRGYVVQVRIKAENGKVQEFKVTENKLDATLPVGLYDVRVAALNKFGKPAAFTDWIPVKLEIKNEQPINLSRAAEPARNAAQVESAKTESAKSEPQAQPGKLPLWNAFIPGLTRIRRGNYWTGGAYIAGLTGIAYLFYSQKIAGDKIAEAPLNDPIFLAPLILSTAQLPGYLLINQRDSQKAAYNKHQKNQKNLAALGVALYAFQCVDALLWADSSGKSISYRSSPGVAGSIAFNVRF
ncbi:MAG: fibronectin type III domain-containing protein [Spirochaetia bacterium]|nr:fibronectin type III domain-containing protein [Spirochaetia bacterium]